LKHFVTIKNVYSEGLLAPRPTPKLEDHPLSAVRDFLFTIFAATLRTRRTSLHPQSEDAPCRGDNRSVTSSILWNGTYKCHHDKQKGIISKENINVKWMKESGGILQFLDAALLRFPLARK
jgi:hypothetical protein